MNASNITVPVPPTSLNYTIWLYLGEYIFAAIAMLVAIPAYLRTLYKYGIQKQKTAVHTSLTMTMFMINEVIHAIIACIQYLYLVFLWRYDYVIYNAFVLYWLGCLMQYTFIVCIGSHIALTIDRCLLIKINISYTKKYQRHFAIIAQVISYAISIGMYFVVNVNSMPKQAETTCRTSSCVHTAVKVFGISTSLTYPYMRIFYSGINILVGITLISLIQQYNNASVERSSYVSRQNKITNKLVIMGVCLDIALDFMVYLLPLLYLLTTGVSLAPIIGPYTHISNAVQVFLSAINYYAIFKRADENSNTNTKTVVQVLSTTNAT